MKGLTNYITEALWVDILTVSFVLVDDAYAKLPKSILPNRKFAPKNKVMFSDSQVITISLFAEMVFDGDEDKTGHFIRQYHLDMFPNLIEKSRFNRRKLKLGGVMEAIRVALRDSWRFKRPIPEE